MKPAITIVADVPSPHQNVLFDAIAEAGELDIEVLFCRRTMRGRAWSGEGPKSCKHQFLSELSIAGVPTDPALLPRLLLSSAHRTTLLIGYYLPAMLAAGTMLAGLRRPWIFWTDTLPTPEQKPGIRGLVRRAALELFLHRSTLCLTTGEAGRKALLAHGVSEARACVSPFVVDQDWIAAEMQRLRQSRLELRGKLGLAADARVLLFIGQLIRRKGVDVLLEALAGRGEGHKISLLIVGEGDEKDELKRRARALQLESRVRFMPYRDNAALPELWAAADGFVLPARFDAWPVVIVEALAAGLPVIGTEACGSVRDLVREGINGFRCEAGDAAGLRAALDKFASAPEAALSKMSIAAQEAVAGLAPRAVARDFTGVIARATELHREMRR